MRNEELPVLTIAAVAELIGVKPHTISQYLAESKPCGTRSGKPRRGRYEDHPFPPPDDYFGKSPWWAPSRADEIRDWDARRAGQGKGGGPKRKRSLPAGT